LPPTSDADWQDEFDKYRASPEFKVLNSNMTLSEFKKIYWMEWSHRLWGRVVGMSFVIPACYFIARRRVSAPTAKRLLLISSLIGFQGFVGWWMVKSGLHEDLLAPGSHPRVSQYRLATHLGVAFVIYSLMLTTGHRILRARAMLRSPADAQKLLANLNSPMLRRYRMVVTALVGLVFTTAMSGALVAGLDAGLIYNEFPYMGLGLTPPKNELWDARYSQEKDQSDLWWRNMMENPSLVQLDHRILAMTTFSAITALYCVSRRRSIKAVLPANVLRGTTGALHLVLMQATLGISTLIYIIPMWLAAMHQAGSLALLTGLLVLRGRMISPQRLNKLVEKHIKK